VKQGNNLSGSESVPNDRIMRESLEGQRIMTTTTTITVDSMLKARLVELARQAGQDVDEFVGALLRRVADTDVRFERGVPTFPRRPGAPTLSVDEVDRLANGSDL
jgi:hypothetical protein